MEHYAGIVKKRHKPLIVPRGTLLQNRNRIETECKQNANSLQESKQEDKTVAKFELPIYGDNDEIVKMYETDHLRYGVLMQALEMQDGMDGMTAAEQMQSANSLVKKVFNGLTDDELEHADAGDVMATFTQVTRHAERIGKTPNGKN